MQDLLHPACGPQNARLVAPFFCNEQQAVVPNFQLLQKAVVYFTNLFHL